MEIPIIKFACMNQLEIFWIKAKKQLIDEKNIKNLQIFNSISSFAGDTIKYL